MSKVGVSEAARMAGITRATMYAHIKCGKLSAERLPDDSGYAIDVAELERVYRGLNIPETPPDHKELQRKIEHLQEQLRSKDELIREKTDRITDLQNMVRALEHRPAAVAPETAPRRSWWARIFGAAA